MANRGEPRINWRLVGETSVVVYFQEACRKKLEVAGHHARARLAFADVAVAWSRVRRRSADPHTAFQHLWAD